MDGLGPGPTRGVDECIDREVGAEGLRGTDGEALVGFDHVSRGAIGLREDRHRRNPHRPAGADDPDRDLSTIRDQDLAKERHAQ